MNIRPAVVAVLVIGLSVVAGPRLAYAASPSAVCNSGVAGDVNGDGFAEVAVGESGSGSNGARAHVFYGTKSGLTASARGSAPDDQVLNESTPGVPGDPKYGEFGATTVFGDFNRDGCADLAVGAPTDDDLGGSVTVLYGSKAGLTTAGAQRFTTESVFGISKDDRCGKVYDDDYLRYSYECEQLGWVLAAGDLDGDGDDDLVAAAPHGNRGSVEVFPGSPLGLQSAGAVLLRADVLGLAAIEGFLEAMTVGDVDGTGADELIIGSWGNVLVVSGFGSNLQPTTIRRYTTTTPGVPGGPNDFFGGTLTAGDVNGDGRDDLAVGTQYPTAVILLLGTPDGLTGTGSQRWTSESPGVEAVAAGGYFGDAMSIADLDGDGRGELVIGAPSDTVDGKSNAGSVTVLRGSAKGLTTAGFGGRIFTQNTPGISEVADRDDSFGAELSTANVRGGKRATIMIGVPSEGRGGLRYAGLLHELGVSKTGPTARGSATWDLARPGVKGRPTESSGFGVINGPSL